MKKCFRKCCQLYSIHAKELSADKAPFIEDFPVLQEFKDVFQEIHGLPPKRDIDFTIYLVPGAVPM